MKNLGEHAVNAGWELEGMVVKNEVISLLSKNLMAAVLRTLPSIQAFIKFSVK